MKLFQIEEPDGGPTDPSAPGAAIGIDAGGAEVEVAFAIGGNASILADREGFERILTVPDPTTGDAQWQELFEAARLRAERALARPVSHAVVVLGAGSVNSDRSARCAQIGRPSVRLLDLEQLHVNPLRAAR